MYRTYQPSPDRLQKWKNDGVKTVINLRGESQAGYYRLEQEACHKLGLTLINFRVYSREAPTKEIIHAAKSLFNEINYPAIMHCKSGADRAGMMSVLYLFIHEGRSLDESLDQLSFKYGHVRQAKTGVIDAAFVAFKNWAAQYKKDLSTHSFLDFVDTEYDPVAIKAAFRSKGWGDILTDIIFRRE